MVNFYRQKHKFLLVIITRTINTIRIILIIVYQKILSINL